MSQSFMGRLGIYTCGTLSCGRKEILLVYQDSSLINPTILDWQALKYETKGYVIVQAHGVGLRPGINKST